jgi:hypothetical protein
MSGLNKWKLALYLAGIFLAGGVSGWVVATKMAKEKAFKAPEPKEIALSFRDRMNARLNLTPEQGREIDAILDRSSAEIQALHGENIKRIKLAINTRNAQINALLNPGQQALFEEIEKERRDSWRSKRSGSDGREGKDGRKSSRDKSGTNSPGVINP